jgi:hypothetical protein
MLHGGVIELKAIILEETLGTEFGTFEFGEGNNVLFIVDLR